MSAVEALMEARAAGVGIALDGADLVLRSSAPPPAAVIKELSRYKADIVALLRAATLDEPLRDVGAAPQPNCITGPTEAKGIPWAEWKAAEINRVFQEQGTSRQPGRITAPTVRHGEAACPRVDSAGPGEQPMSRAEATK